jgi:2'-5' RNA ligase
MAKLRLFVAIEMPPEMESALDAAITMLRRDLEGPFAWTPPESSHLTLKFLGDVDAGRVDELSDALVAATAPLAQFDLQLSGTGTFPAEGRPSVVWAGLGGDIEALERLRVAVESAALGLGFEAETRAFQPHLTLGRINGGLPDKTMRALRDRLAKVRWPKTAAFDVEGVSMVRSELRRGGPRYTTLAVSMLAS